MSNSNLEYTPPERVARSFAAFALVIASCANGEDEKLDLHEPETSRLRSICGEHGRCVPHRGKCPKCGGYVEMLVN